MDASGAAPQPPPPGGRHGWAARLALVGSVAKALGFLAVAGATTVVLLDLFGAISVFDGHSAQERRSTRLPGEYLYLDDERVDAYLGQLHGGLAPTETRSRSIKRAREAKLGAGDVVQVGGSLEEQEAVQQTVSSRAADRYYMLEGELRDRFEKERNEPGPGIRRVRATDEGCREIANPRTINEGDIVRITGAKLQVPTYALALAKTAHAAQYLAPGQLRQGFRVTREALSQLGRGEQGALRSYVHTLGRDPRFLLRLAVGTGERGPTCTVLMPVRYSKLTEAPSLLTGRVTIAGKVVRRLTEADPRYFDVETAVTYERVIRSASGAIRRTLGLEGRAGLRAVQSSAVARYPGLVVLPLAMYK